METLSRITRSHPEHEFYFLFDRPFDGSFIFSQNVHPIVVGPPARHPVLWYVWFELSLPSVLRKIAPDLFLSPDGFLSLNTDVRSLPVIHDLNFVHNPKDLAASHTWFYNRYFQKYARKAYRIATVSEFSKADIATQYGIDELKIDVVYNGVSDRFKPSNEDEKSAVRNRWTNGKPYFIYVGAIHQRKNIERMFAAYDRFRARSGTDMNFILVGNRKWWTAEMQAALDDMKFRSEVIFTGRVSESDLQGLLGAALASVYVSTFEGFGIPIIEAFQAQVPVITSNLTSMPEVAGNAALLVQPYNVEEIADAMFRLWSEDDLRSDLIQKGTVRAGHFTWDRSADLLWKSIERALE